MHSILRATLTAIAAGVLLTPEAEAVRIDTNPATDTELQFANIAISADGETIFANGVFSASLAAANRQRVYSLAVPADPATQTVTPLQITTTNTGIPYDTDFTPVVTTTGSVLVTHDALGGTNRLYTVPAAGEGGGAPSGFFNFNPNLVPPGNGSIAPKYSPDGSTLYFLNSDAGFGGVIPAFPGSPVPFIPQPDWDVLYRIPAAGGAATPVTTPQDGDLDLGFFDLTPDGNTVVYAPDNPVITGNNRDNIRPRLYTVPSTGGSSVEVPITPAAHEFTITNQLAVAPGGQSVLFIADYDEVGKQELFSLPLSGGTPTRISDPLPFAGDVTSFAVSPDGLSVAYAAGQNTSATTELFMKPLAGGSSVRISDAPPSNSGQFDVNTSLGEGDQSVYEGGQIVFDPDGSRVFYLGALTTPGVVDLYVTDTTAKAGLTPSAFTYTGAPGGDFFDETNWTDADGASPAAGTINPGTGILHSLVIDGDSVTTSGGEIDFGFGGSLELTVGSVLSLPDPGGQLDFNPGSGLKATDATITAFADIILEGTTVLSGGLLESTGDDVEFQDRAEATINGTTLRAFDNLLLDNSVTAVSGATFESNDRLGLRFEVDFDVTDTMIDIDGGLGDLEDIFSGARGEGSTLTLRGTSMLLADTIEDGVDLVLEDEAVASFVDSGPVGGASQLVDQSNGESTVTVNSTGAELVIRNDSDFDPRAFIINGLTGLTYLEDPTAWNVTDWNGLTPLASLRLAGGPAVEGDFNGDGQVDNGDLNLLLGSWGDSTVPPEWINGFTAPVDNGELNALLGNWGFGVSAAVPEPVGVLGWIVAMAMGGRLRRR